MHAWETIPFKPFRALEELSNDAWSSPFHEIFGTLRYPNAWKSWQMFIHELDRCHLSTTICGK